MSMWPVRGGAGIQPQAARIHGGYQPEWSTVYGVVVVVGGDAFKNRMRAK